MLLYGCETWRMTKRDETKLDTFLHKCLRRIPRIYWPMKVLNEEVRRRLGLAPSVYRLRWQRWHWIGHVMRMDHHQNPRIALTWATERKRSRGRPKEIWRRTVEGARQEDGFCHLDASCHCGEKQSRMEETSQWHSSPRGELGISSSINRGTLANLYHGPLKFGRLIDFLKETHQGL